MIDPPPVPSDHPDKVRWNARWEAAEPLFEPHPLVQRALDAGVPGGPVLELAGGMSGSALALAAAGRDVTVVDVSDVGLARLEAEARVRGLSARIRTVVADLLRVPLPPGAHALVLATRYWEPAVFAPACATVAPGGVLAWSAFTLAHPARRPGFRPEWCVRAGEPASLLPPGFAVVAQQDEESERSASRWLVARRDA